MSEDTKVILRPKVRFSEFPDNEENEKRNGHRKDGAIPRTNGPKIKSIVTLKKPVRIVEPKKSINAHRKDVPPSSSEIEILIHSSDTTSNKILTESLSNDNTSKDETSNILRNAYDLRSKKENGKTSQLDKSICSQRKNRKKSLPQKGKENKNTMLSKQLVSDRNIVKSKIESSRCGQSVVREKLKVPENNADTAKVDTCSKSLKLTKTQSISNMKKPANRANKGIHDVKRTNIMPCYRHRGVAKSKASPVKKTVLRDMTGPKIKTSVEPGVSRKRLDDTKGGDADEKYMASDITAEKLAQPEYNSIACTINKLKELRRQRVVTDIEHLPPMQKNLLSGKISTALDFPLEETIYKSLVDLSIDDKELPSAIKRSKDPLPRQKDIVPKLSDFFVPENPKEICTAVQVKPRLPKIDDNLDPFKISDMIFKWECNLDDTDTD